MKIKQVTENCSPLDFNFWLSADSCITSLSCDFQIFRIAIEPVFYARNHIRQASLIFPSQSTFPHLAYTPSFFRQGSQVSLVSLLGGNELGVPPIRIGVRDFAEITTVEVPVAPMDLDDGTVLGEHQVWFPRQIFSVERIAKALVEEGLA